MWLLFKPNNGIWVPLSKVDWAWSAVGNSGVGLTSTNNTVNPVANSTFTYPVWTDNVTNHEYNP
jgi:hypothetical protein